MERFWQLPYFKQEGGVIIVIFLVPGPTSIKIVNLIFPF
jgi:hypothetical protein